MCYTVLFKRYRFYKKYINVVFAQKQNVHHWFIYLPNAFLKQNCYYGHSGNCYKMQRLSVHLLVSKYMMTKTRGTILQRYQIIKKRILTNFKCQSWSTIQNIGIRKILVNWILFLLDFFCLTAHRPLRFWQF